MKRFLLAMVLASAACGGATPRASEPVVDVSARRHPNLAHAQELIVQAFDRIRAAQDANEFDMDGHAARAKELLDQAAEEIKLAAEAANAHR